MIREGREAEEVVEFLPVNRKPQDFTKRAQRAQRARSKSSRILCVLRVLLVKIAGAVESRFPF
jgi:hypothetical protein